MRAVLREYVNPMVQLRQTNKLPKRYFLGLCAVIRSWQGDGLVVIAGTSTRALLAGWIR